MGQAEEILDVNSGELESSVLVSVYKKNEYCFVYVFSASICIYRSECVCIDIGCVYKAER